MGSSWNTRYIRGEFAVPGQDAVAAQMQGQPGPLYAHDAAAALGIEDIVGVHVGYRWANNAARWEVCLVDRETGEPAGPWTAVPPRG